MSTQRQTRAVLALAGIAAIAACSNGSAYAPQVPANSALGMRFVDPATVKAQISVATYTTSNSTPVSVFATGNTKNKPPFCKITKVGEAINALGVDSSGNLWVPEGTGTGGVADVVEFKPNCGAVVTTLSDSNGQPAGIAFASNGTAYVNNILGASSSAGNVAIYPKGATKPSKFLTNKAVFLAAGVGIDSKNNIYLSYYDSSDSPGMLVFAGGKMPGKTLKNFALGNPGVPAFDKKDNMIVTDDSDHTLNVYAPPYTGKPKTYQLKGSSPQCSLNAAQSNLACGDKTNGSVDVYAYPTGKYQYSFNKGLSSAVIGVVQSPI
jgi:sugar lactone lactonase YvrE